MGSIKISQLNSLNSKIDSDVIPIVNEDTTYKISISDLHSDLATLTTNEFNGNQTINGNVNISGVLNLAPLNSLPANPLNGDVANKIHQYHTDYNNRPSNDISFMTTIASTSGCLHSEFA